ncbi:HRDC domain-containing protein [Blastococcus sp. Marseille-P5729]|uniref:HRDC domain-containing protein n=1 Tax=Blastococcus sp. Marseille-P5729 TaxID=2086582 RepID=UPI000D0FC447|nr:HRDC domain-containing protein [Blastococcus sp. Marseille-P5729]
MSERSETPGEQDAPQPEPTPLLAPRGGVPEVTATAAGVAKLAERLAAGNGPVAVDAERASGFRYSARAQLVQLNRRGAGIALVDPVAAGDLSLLGDVLQDAEWVFHAAIADLPCLAEIGMRPDRIFDTELGGRIAGFERVSLGAMTESLLGLRLAKGHSAADWSRRPLPADFLTYAALDVDILLDLRDEVERALREQGKLDWAHEEFEAVRTARPSEPRADPWRRTSGLQQVKTRRGMAVVKALWESRDELAQQTDTSPGRLLPDRAISAAAAQLPTTMQQLLAIDGFSRRGALKHRRRWYAALQDALQEPESRLPRRTPPIDPNAPPSRSMGKENDVADRYALAREAVLQLSERLSIPAENLVPPAAVRSLAWTPPSPITAESVSAQLREHGARDWQIGQVAAQVAAALARHTPRD